MDEFSDSPRAEEPLLEHTVDVEELETTRSINRARSGTPRRILTVRSQSQPPTDGTTATAAGSLPRQQSTLTSTLDGGGGGGQSPVYALAVRNTEGTSKNNAVHELEVEILTEAVADAVADAVGEVVQEAVQEAVQTAMDDARFDYKANLYTLVAVTAAVLLERGHWFAWTDDAKLHLAANVLGPKLDINSEVLIQNVAALNPIIPGRAYALKKLKPADLVTLASKVDDVPAMLIELREALPPCIDVARLISMWPDVLLLPINSTHSSVKNGYQAVLNQFKIEIGEDGVNEMLETTPQLLDSQILADVIRGSGHLMPLRQLASSLARYEDYWMQFQTLEKEPRNDYEATLHDDVYSWKEDVVNVQRGG